VATAATPSPSAIPNHAVFSIAISPAFAKTALAVAYAVPFGGTSAASPSPSPSGQPAPSGKQGVELWVTRDGGATWHKAAAKNWAGAAPRIAVSPLGRDRLFATSKGSLQVSDDFGETWSNLAPVGGNTAVPSPRFDQDGTLAVAGTTDYLVTGATAHTVPGSGGQYDDYAFAQSPEYPEAGRYPSVLLTAIGTQGKPVIMTCDAAFKCAGASVLAAPAMAAPANLFLSSAYATDGTVFAQTQQGVFKSIDGGRTFSPVQIVPTSGASGTATSGFALAPGYSESSRPVAYGSILQVYTADPRNPYSSGGVYRTADGGATWHQLGQGGPLDGGALSVAVAPTGRLFAGFLKESADVASAGLVCSQNGGSAWAASCSAMTSIEGPLPAAAISGAQPASTSNSAPSSSSKSGGSAATRAAATAAPRGSAESGGWAPAVARFAGSGPVELGAAGLLIAIVIATVVLRGRIRHLYLARKR
jgi:photosystem II stability/assembly factor-like uncharacterized protein